MGKKITVFLLAALLALPLGVLTANAASSMENAKSATVLVGDGDGNNLYGGFIVSVTNSYTYIVTSPGTIGQGDMAVIFYEYLDAGEIVWTDSTGSYILIAVKTTSEITGRFKQMPLARLSTVETMGVYHRLYVDTSEAGNPNLEVASEHVRSRDAVATGFLTNGFWTDSSVSYYQELGGPVVSGNGVAVGVGVYASVDGEETSSVAIALDELMDCLDANGIPYTTGTPTGSGSGGSSGGGSSGGGSSGGSDGGLTNNILMGAGIGAAVGLGAWFLRKKKEPSAGSASGAGSAVFPTSPLPRQAGMTLVGQGGAMNGRRFPCQGDSLSMGRDSARCAIVYPDGEPGVSRLHCQLVRQNGRWTLTDMGSAYGTYLNGTKIEADIPYPLRDGDVFYLASQANSFVVEER